MNIGEMTSPKENARRTLKLSIPKLQMAEQQRFDNRPQRIVNGSDITVIPADVHPPQSQPPMSAMFLSATTPQSAKTVSPCSGTNRCSPGLNHFLDANPKQFSRFLSFSPSANSSYGGNFNGGGLMESSEMVVSK